MNSDRAERYKNSVRYVGATPAVALESFPAAAGISSTGEVT
jgi:hypothetical protein